VSINHNLLESFRQYRLVIFDLGSEHFGDPRDELILNVYDTLAMHKLNFLVITHLPEQHNIRPNLKYCPNEYHISREFLSGIGKKDLFGNRKFPLSCLNNSSWPHRIYNYVKLRQQQWFDQILWSINFNFDIKSARPDSIELDDNTVQSWSDLSSRFKSNYIRGNLQKEAGNSGSAWAVDNPGYQDSYANLITETVVLPGVYISEKTWKPIANGMWFFVLGCPGTVAHLRSLGVDTFDDLIDHDAYDQEVNFYKRVDRLHTVIEKYTKLDHKKLWRETVDRRRVNQEKFLNGDFDKKYLNEVKKIVINKCKLINHR